MFGSHVVLDAHLANGKRYSAKLSLPSAGSTRQRCSDPCCWENNQNDSVEWTTDPFFMLWERSGCFVGASCLHAFIHWHVSYIQTHTHLSAQPSCVTLEQTCCLLYFAEIMKLNVQIPTVCRQHHAVKHIFSIVGGLASCDKGPASMSHKRCSDCVSNIPN